MKLPTVTIAGAIGLIGLFGTPSAYAQAVKPSCTDASRKCMIIAATSYLDGLVNHDGSKVLYAPDVKRTEQGHVTGKGEADLRASLPKEPDMIGRENTRFFVDEKNHQVIYFTLLRLPPTDTPAAAGRYPRPAGKADTIHLAERIKVEHGLITEIEAIFTHQDGTSEGESGWPD